MKTTLQKASELVARLGGGQIHTMTMRQPLATLKTSDLVGEKESKTQVRAVGYENTAKTKALRAAGVERSEIPSGYETTGLEEFNGKVLRGIKSRDLHLNLAFVRSLGKIFIVDGNDVPLHSIAADLMASEKKVSRPPKVVIDPVTGEELESQRWMRPKVKNIVGMDLAHPLDCE